MNQEVFDARLQHFLRKMINYMTPEEQLQLKSVRSCNTKIIPSGAAEDAVFLLRNDSNGGEAKFFGQVTCKNPWVCPHCSSLMMNHYRKRIVAAIDCLRDKKKPRKERKMAFMVSFAIPHLKELSCREVTDVLYNTWRTCFHMAFRNRKTTKGEFRPHNIFNSFFHEFNIKYYVRAAEITQGVNGWHPHFHVLFWIPRKMRRKLNVDKWETALNDYWFQKSKEEYKKYFVQQDLYTSDLQETFIHNMYGDKVVERRKTYEKHKNQSVTFSRYDDGFVRESVTSDYLCGWGADRELTGNQKKEATHSEHKTPYQLLENAANGDMRDWGRYREFLFALTAKPAHHRVKFARGMNKMIDEWIHSEGSVSSRKKKQEEVQKEWKLFAWFTKPQWWSLCDLDRNSPVLSNILCLAALNRKDLLKDYLASLNIDLIERPHFLGMHVQNIFNHCCRGDTQAG